MTTNEECQLFILLPEYEEAEKTSENIRTIPILETSEINEYVKLLGEIEERGKAEHYKLYYDRNNIDNFLIPLIELRDCYPPIEDGLLLSLNRVAENWRDEMMQDEHFEYKLFSKIVVNDSFCEVCERKHQSMNSENDSTFAIINNRAINRIPKIAEMTRDNKRVSIDVIDGYIESIESWLSTNRRPLRIYNWNSKHGEYGKGAHKSHNNDTVSILYCSKEHAAELLAQAIGSDADSGPLYAWDEENHRYMEFKRDSDYSVSFHSYHLENDDRKIPSIKKLLGRR